VRAAVEALQPTAAWIAEHEAVGAHMRAAIMTRPPGDRVLEVEDHGKGLSAILKIVADAERHGEPGDAQPESLAGSFSKLRWRRSQLSRLSFARSP
jgi:hypothetical protein